MRAINLAESDEEGEDYSLFFTSRGRRTCHQSVAKLFHALTREWHAFDIFQDLVVFNSCKLSIYFSTNLVIT